MRARRGILIFFPVRVFNTESPFLKHPWYTRMYVSWPNLPAYNSRADKRKFLSLLTRVRLSEAKLCIGRFWLGCQFTPMSVHKIRLQFSLWTHLQFESECDEVVFVWSLRIHPNLHWRSTERKTRYIIRCQFRTASDKRHHLHLNFFSYIKSQVACNLRREQKTRKLFTQIRPGRSCRLLSDWVGKLRPHPAMAVLLCSSRLIPCTREWMLSWWHSVESQPATINSASSKQQFSS